MAKSLAQRAKRDPKLLRRALRNPGLRSKLPSSMLTGKQRRQRAYNTRQAKTQAQAQAKRQAAKAPIVPGSAVTERQLSKDTKAAMGVKYGPLEAAQRRDTQEAQTWQRDIGGYYDQYLQHIAQQAANVRQIGAEANTAMQGLQGGITGLAGADVRDIQNQANQDAAARGATPGSQIALANQAAAVRQGITGSQGIQLATQNAAASRYADTLSNVVAPGQKLQGVAMARGRVRQARQKMTDTARERGASAQQYKSERRSEEAKNVLAAQALNLKTAAEAGEQKDERARRKETKRHNKAMEGAKGQTVNKYGYTERDWRAMTTAERQKVIRSFGAKGKGSGGGKDGTGKNRLLAPGDTQAGITNAAQLKQFVQKARTGKSFVAGHGPQKKLGRHGASVKILENVDVKNPVLLSAALDAVYGNPPRIGEKTAKRLRRAGYRPQEVADALGVSLSGKTKGSSGGYGGPHGTGRP